jgi:hypothetical protein
VEFNSLNLIFTKAIVGTACLSEDFEDTCSKSVFVERRAEKPFLWFLFMWALCLGGEKHLMVLDAAVVVGVGHLVYYLKPGVGILNYVNCCYVINVINVIDWASLFLRPGLLRS